MKSPVNLSRRSKPGFTLVELLIVVSIIGITVLFSTFSVGVIDNFKLTNRVNNLLDEISQCREEAIFLSKVCSVHIETPETKRIVRESSIGVTVLIGGYEYRHFLIPFDYKISNLSQEHILELRTLDDDRTSDIDLTYPRNIDTDKEKDPFIKQGIISFFPDASYTPFLIEYRLSLDGEEMYLYGDGYSLPTTMSENPARNY